MTADEDLVAMISRSSSELIDGRQREKVSEIWQNGAALRADIGRSLVVVCIDNTMDGISLYLNFTFGAAVPVFFPSDTKLNLLEQFINDFQPTYLIAPQGAIMPQGVSPHTTWGTYGIYRVGPQPSRALNKDLCLLATTSGSTGSPKVVRQTYANVLENSSQIVSALSLGPDSIAITSLPISYTYGMSVVNCQLMTGGDLVVTDQSPTQKGFLELLLNENVTLLAGVPQTYTQLNAMRFFKSRYAAGIKTYLQAGGKLPHALEEDLSAKVAQAGSAFFVMYGQAEATTRMSVLPAEEFGIRKGSVGRALPGSGFCIVSPEGVDLGANREGEILYQGANVSQGYATSLTDLNDPDSFKGVLRTGDIGYLDDDGYLFITGRLKRFAKIQGHSVNLSHLEDLLYSGLQAEVACLEKDGRICVFHEGNVDDPRFAAVLEDATTLMLRDTHLYSVTKLPKTASGKIQYTGLVKLLQSPSENSSKVNNADC